MPRPILLLSLILGCAPGDAPQPSPDGARLADCLLAGAPLELSWARTLDATPITALAVGPDGTVAVGERHGAVGILREPETAPHEILVPAAGGASTTLAFAADGGTLVSGDALGQVAAWELGGNGPHWWETISEKPVPSVATTSDGEHVAWIDEGWTGNATLWGWTGAAPIPSPVQTTELWAAHATTFTPDDTRWLIAGHWYGVPLLEVRASSDPEVPLAEWMSPGVVQGAVTALAPRSDGRRVWVGGSSGDAQGGFLAAIDLGDGDLEPGLTTADEVLLEDHRPGTVHLLPGEDVLLTVGEAGHLLAWATDGLERLTTLGVDAPGPTAVDPTGEVLFVADDRSLEAYRCGL